MYDTGIGVIDNGRSGRASWIRQGVQEPGIERIEAFFDGRGYEMHRHDTYAIGLTLNGVQSFHYRGAVRHGLAGGALILHPDEKHDGQSGAEGGFHYRMLYVEPAAIQSILGARPLPFVPGGLSDDKRLLGVTRRLLGGLGQPLDPLDREEALFDLATVLNTISDCSFSLRPRIIDYRSVETVRAFLHSLPTGVDLALLEQISGRDRWGLSRDFRSIFGTSPYRYLVLRRLDAARDAMRSGMSLTEAALESGFADQSHMTRQFSAAFGLTPARWLRLQAS